MNSSRFKKSDQASLFSRINIFALFISFAAISACSSETEEPDRTAEVEARLQTVIEKYDVRAVDPTTLGAPSIDDPLSQLGKKLFFTKALSGEQDTACASCHHPSLGGGDDLSLPIGVDAVDPDLLGPGRRHQSSADHWDGGPTVPRNSPTVFNFVLYEKTVFHDGRIEAVEGGIRTPNSELGLADPNAGDSLAAAQARFPVTSAEEMRGFHFAANEGDDARLLLGKRLRGDSGELDAVAVQNWDAEFAAVFGHDVQPMVNYHRVAAAIAAYENSQLFIDNAWFRYLNGDQDALTLAAKRGAILFNTPAADGGAGCTTCHSGPAMTDESFHVLAMPQIGRGKGDDANLRGDHGRYRESHQPDDKYAFRTPSLLNVTETGPYGHSGAYADLESVVQHHLDPLTALENFDLSQLDEGIQSESLMYTAEESILQLERLRAEGKNNLPLVQLSEGEQADLMAFLQALTDPCVQSRECLSRWIPGPEDSDPDQLRLVAKDRNGELL
ncbi:cytochrome-c peroxidase [Allohahella marinimesophila]